MDTPIHQHDCDNCKFLGSVIGGGKMHDMYSCTTERGTSVVARYGEEGEYFSSDISRVTAFGHAELFVAKHLFMGEQF